MSRNKHDRDELLAETFHGDWSHGPAAGFAKRAARLARRSHRLRQTLAASSLAAGFALAAFISFRPSAPSGSATGNSFRVTPVCEIISDDELIAQLKDRPLLVQSRPDGSREIVLLEN